MPYAIAREVSASLARCQLTHLEREPIDVERARREHAGYLDALRSLGCRVVLLEEQPDLPDAVFVEDVALVFDELAVSTRPGVRERRGEVETVAEALSRHRRVVALPGQGTLDGGDVVRMGRDVWVGRSSRSDEDGIGALRGVLEPEGYRVRGVDVDGCLHLKSAASFVAPETLLVNPAWVDAGAFGASTVIRVAPDEPMAANALAIGATVVHSSAYPRTQHRLREHGLTIEPVEAGEIAKAEGGVTCCSLIFD